MPNNYLQFSFAVPLNTPEKETWAREAVAWLKAAERDPGPIIDLLDSAHTPGEFEALLPDEFADNEQLGYSVEVDEDGLWFYTDESGTPDFVVPFVQAFLLKFDPKGCVAFEWADTCSVPRIDEFGGGATFITALSVEYMNTGTWVTQKLREHEAAS